MQLETVKPAHRTLAALGALGRDGYLNHAEMNALSSEEITHARTAVQQTVTDKIGNFLRSRDRADGR